jgi:hypothetical protein
MGIGFEKRFLKNILGIVVILGNLLRHAKDTAIVMADEFRKRRRVACFCASD